MKYSGAQITIKLLQMHEIDTVIGIPGGSNLPLYDALYNSTIRHILARHEQGAGFIAQGIARSSGKAAVCFATSGPGATNLLTAIADAKLDSVPIIAITGQVPGPMIGTDAFQEVDTIGMSMPVTKHNFLVRSAQELLSVIPEAFRIACCGRGGPVLIDIPKDVQQQIIEVDFWPTPAPCNLNIFAHDSQIEETVSLINSSKRPVLYIGGGVINADASRNLLAFARKNSIPITSTLMGLGAVPNSEPLYLGMLGMHGARFTNKILHECDLLLALGVRFDDRATGKVSHFCPQAKIIHVDIDKAEINKIKSADIAITADVNEFLSKLLERIQDNSRDEWLSYINSLKKMFPFPAIENDNPYSPLNIIRTISALAQSDSIVTTDVGQHQMWVAQIYPFNRPRTFLTSGGLGTMGFGLPASIGAALANPDKQIICFTGDGSLLMNIQELDTVAELNLNIKIILLNNGHLGLVCQQQELFYNKNYIASRFYSKPSFCTIANGFGVKAIDLSDETKPVPVLGSVLSENGPCLINIPIQETSNVLPIVPPGAANHEMIGD